MIAEFAFVSGILTTVLHVLTGPDHLAAVTPLILESRKKAWKLGLVWGFGHILGMGMIGFLFLLFRNLLPIDQISNFSEQLVGLVLIGIGIWAFYKVFNTSQNHIHDVNTNYSNSRKTEGIKTQSYFASFSIGILHGFAGIGHFILFFPVLGFDDQWDSVLYIIGSCVGILLAMTAFAFVIGKVALLTQKRSHPFFFKGIRLASGLLALIIGTYWLLSF